MTREQFSRIRKCPYCKKAVRPKKAKETKPEEWLTVAVLSERFQITDDRIRKAGDKGKIQRRKVKKGFLYRLRDAERLYEPRYA